MRLGLEPDSRSSGLLQKLQIIPSSQSSPMSGALASCSQSLSRMEGFHIQVQSQSEFQTHKCNGQNGQAGPLARLNLPTVCLWICFCDFDPEY